MDRSVPIAVKGCIDDDLPMMAQVCLARGHVGVSAVEVSADGRFDVVAKTVPGLHLLLVIADGREAVRRQLTVQAPGLTLDVGPVALVPVEWPAGVHGYLWDEDAQSPVHGGLAALSTDKGVVVGQTRAELDGAFIIPMTCQRPLPPGDYRLDASAPGYSTETIRVPIALEPSVTELGRVHLMPLSSSR